jgi:hypothetical protein
VCELADGTVVPPSAALPLALQGPLRRAVFGPDGEILDYGRRSRFFTGALREAIGLRDRCCRHPACDVPADRCQVDHIRPWHPDGTTTITNGQCLCRAHNHAKGHRPPPPHPDDPDPPPEPGPDG